VFVSAAVLDLFTNREKAIALWALAILTFALVKGEGVGSALLGVLRALLHPMLLLMFESAAVYCTAVVLLAYRVGIWHTTAMKETIYWFIGTGLAIVGNATSVSPHDPTYFKRLLRNAIRFTLIVDFLVAVYVFPLVVELFLIPLVLLLVGMQLVAERDPNLVAAKKVIDAVLLLIGVSLMLYVTISAVTDFSGLLSRENAERFLLAPALTIAFLPFLYAVAWASRRELDNLRERHLPVRA
jgi:hypothetical protein